MTLRSMQAASLIAGVLALLSGPASAQQAGALAPRVDFGRPLEPVGNKVLHCAGQSPPAFAAYAAAMKPRLPAIYMSYASLGWADLKGPLAKLSADLDHYPADMMLQLGVDMLAPAQPGASAQRPLDADVASGRFDGRIAALVDALKAIKRPVFIRLGYEFNGQWNGYTPASYKAAWRRVAAAIHAAHLSNVALIWCFAPQASNLDFASFYPGDDVVDWWAIDMFKAADFDNGTVQAFLDDAKKHRFPVMIAESTPVGVGAQASGSWNNWFVKYFDFIQREPEVKAFCYIDWNWKEHPRWADWGDARLEQNTNVLSKWKGEIGQSWVVNEGQH